MNTTLDADHSLALLTARPSSTGIFCDFDGTLSRIVEHPDAAQPVAGAAEVFEELARYFALVGVISGRSSDDLRSRFAPAGVLLAGSYGREGLNPHVDEREDLGPVADAAQDALVSYDGVLVERKGGGVALHYRTALEHADDVMRVAIALSARFGLELLPGRRVIELVRPGPGKSDALRLLVASNELDAFLFAGDDLADVRAFEWARASGASCVLVGVTSEECPPELRELADLVVEGPEEVVALFAELAERVRSQG
jgi:trehalose 6-phosphate phosphatase